MATIDAYTESDFKFYADVTLEIDRVEECVDVSMTIPINSYVEVTLDEDQIEEVLDQHVNDIKFIFDWMINSDLVGEFIEHVLSPETADNWGEDVAKPIHQALFEGDTKGLFDFIFGKTEGEYNNPVSDQTDVLDDLRSKLGPEAKAYQAKQLNPVEA